MKNLSPQVEMLPQRETFHLAYLDSLRGLAALYIVLHHATLQINFSENNPNIFVKSFVYVTMNGFQYGHYAVDLFIVLSGFCLMLPVIRNDGEIKGGAINFFKKRVRRILPPYYLAMGLSLLLIFTLIGNKTGTHWDASLPVTSHDIIAHLLLIQDLFREMNAKINHAFWSISVEWRIYFLFPILILLWRRFGAVKVAASTLTLSSLLYFVLYLIAHFVPSFAINLSPWGSCPHYIGLFALGMLSAEIAYSSQSTFPHLRKNLPWKMMALIAAAASLIIYDTAIHSGYLWVVADLIAGVGFACLLIVSSFAQTSWLTNLLTWKPLVFIGGFAYSLYLVHAPLLQVISQYLLDPLGLTNWMALLVMFVVGTPIVVGFSYLFFVLFERPFLTKKRLIV